MLAMSCCQSSKLRPVDELTLVYIPAAPKPKSSIVIPLDADNKIVHDAQTEIVNIQMPFWYYKQIVNYMVDVTEVKRTIEAYQAH